MVTRRKRQRQNPQSVEALEVRALLATFTVDSLEDKEDVDGKTTLREALQLAEDRPGPDVVAFKSTLKGTLRLELGSLRVASSVELIGPGSGQLFIDATEASKGLNIVSGTSSFEGFTIGNSVGPGVLVGGTPLEFEDVHFVNNGDGGLKRRYTFSGSTNVIIRNSEFRGNESANGGALYAQGGHVVVETTRFENNSARSSGGAIYMIGGALTIADSTFSSNTANSNGGAIEFASSRRSSNPNGPVEIQNSQFINNRARTGGAIQVWTAELSIRDSVISRNDATYGGGVYRSNSATEAASLLNSTVSENTARISVGGVTGFSSIKNSTIAFNRSDSHGPGGAGLSSTTVESSIIAGNVAGATASDISGTATFKNSLIGASGSSGPAPTGQTPDADGNLAGTTASPLGPGLMPLGSYGTETLFHPLKTNSLGVDRGSNPESLANDQRGKDRKVGAGADMGAVEVSLSAYLDISGARVSEANGGQLEFDVRLVGDPQGAFNVTARTTTRGSAGANDFTAVNTQLSFDAAGQVRTVVVPVTDDTREEADETVVLRLVDVTSQQVGLPEDTAVGTIENDDEQRGIHVFSDNTVVIRGDDRNDTITIHKNDTGNIVLTLNNRGHVLPPDKVHAITVYALGGNDSVIARDITAPMYVGAGAGDDTVKTGVGSDTVYGGAGDDQLRGTKGNDLLIGSDGRDTVLGQSGDDTIRGGSGDDRLIGDVGDDEIHGEGGDDYVRGNDGDDTLTGDKGADMLMGDLGRDSLFGGADNDTLLGGDSHDHISGGDGNDSINGSGGNDTLEGERGADTITGSSGSDKMSGSNGPDVLLGGVGNDSIRGGNGDDTISGGDGNDTLLGGQNNDSITGGGGNDTIAGENGRDHIRAGAGTDTVNAGNGNDTVFGELGNDMIDGSGGNDLLTGEEGLDVIVGGDGSDTIKGGADGDLLIGGRISSLRFRTTLRELDFNWHSGESYAVREADVRETLKGGSRQVFDDDAKDNISGGEGRDLFWVQTTDPHGDLFSLEQTEIRRRI